MIYNAADDDQAIVYPNTFTEVNEVDGDVTYNVYINGFSKYVFKVYGIYDATAGTLTVPVGQVVWDNPDAYGACAIFGYNENDEYFSDLVFQEDNEGNFELTNDGYEVVIVNEESQWYNYYIVDETEVMYYKPNATFTYQAPTSTSYKSVTGSAYVEDYGEELNVYGLFSYVGDASITSIQLNADGEARIYSDQQVDSEDQSDYVKENYGVEGDFGYIRFVMWLNVVSEDEIYLATEDTPDANLAYGYSAYLPGKVDESKAKIDFSPYIFTFATAYVNGVGALNYGQFKGLNIELTNGKTFEIVTGINNVKADTANKTAKTYNLMGQEVNANTKGLIIRDGKKFVNK